MKDKWTKTALLALALLLTSGTIMYSALQKTARADRIRLNSMYQRAFYETCELVAGIQSNLKKLSVTENTEKRQELLNEISRQAEGAQSNLSVLPVGVHAVSATMKFVNQMGDYARALSRKLSTRIPFTQSDTEQILTLTDSAADFAYQLNDLLDRYNDGTLRFEEYEFEFPNEAAAAPLNNPAASYPTLLYDGPFSDGAREGEYKNLPAESVTAEQARQALRQFLNDGLTEIRETGMSGGELPCYEFACTYQNYKLIAGVTQKGGKVLYLLPEENEYAQNESVQACMEAAQTFLEARGFPAVTESYHRVYNGIITFNFAPVENEIVLFPDILKVQVSMKEKTIVGFEGNNYYRNHTSREWGDILLTQEQAEERIGSMLTPVRARLTVIPLNSVEKLCHEITATDGNETYLVYIDAFTGVEHVVYQVVQTDEGTLVQ